MVCEFCGGPAEGLARTQRQAWYGCHRCHRTWKEDAAHPGAVEAAHPSVPPSLRVTVTRGCVLAAAAVVLAFAIRLALKPMIGSASPFLLFTPAVMLAAFYGGMVPGLVATVLSGVLGNHFFLQTLGEPGVERWDRIALFALVGGLITWLTVASRNARAELAASLWREQAARAEAEAANHTKDEFLALVSHELQTPASVILGWASIVRRQSLAGPALDRALDTIERNARLQSRLVGDVLDSARIVSGSLRLDRRVVDLGPIVAAAVEQIRPAADARHLQVDLEMSDTASDVLGDPVRLQQVFTNLLSNAVKFTPEGGRIHVRIATTAGEVRTSVSDSGLGIDPGFLPRIFQRFEQDPGTLAHSRSGLGLGLSIARHFVERHNGTIRAESAGRGHGATFEVTLPRVQPAGSWDGAAERRVSPDALRTISVLVVEDDDDTRLLVASSLERYGARVISVGTADAARTVALRLKPDVMICDLRLPVEDGIALVRSLRSMDDRAVAAMPAASMTASVCPEDRERALEAGYQVHLQKPIDPDELASVVLTLAGAADPAPPVIH